MSEQFDKIVQLVEKISLELVYAEPGTDAGLLPVNSLLSDIEEVCAGNRPPDPIPVAISWARSEVDGAFMEQGFSEEAIKAFNDWLEWMRHALHSAQTEQDIPTFGLGRSIKLDEIVEDEEVVDEAADEEAPAAEAADLSAEDPLTFDAEEDGDLIREFINEADEHLQNIEGGVLVLEENPTDADTLNSIFRAFHTFKGGSGFLNLIPINRLAHALEDLLDLARQNKLEITSDVINVILEGGDTLRQFVERINAQLSGEEPIEPFVIPIQEQLLQIEATVKGRPAEKAAEPTKAEELPVTEPSPAPKAAAPKTQSATPKPEAKSVPSKSGGNNGSASVVKVDTQKLDSLVDLVGEVVVAQSLVTLDPDIEAIESQHLSRNLAQLGRITKELQRIAMSMRMVPIRGCFQKMNRLVRDLTAKSGKRVDLQLTGEDTELDRNIVEAIGDPLVHMVRNSVDHGIEMPDVRSGNGKSPTGTLKLKAYHQGGNIVIEIQDDGAGLNKERILKKAIENEVIRPDEHLTDKEIFELIFAPGFSTAEKITDISGRGVGMDVVRRNIEKLRGKIEIQSEPGKGSTFSIYLPLTLAIIDGLLFAVGNQRFILPTLSVRESFRPTKEMLSRVRERGEMVNVRDRLIPVLRMYEHFGIEPQTTDPCEAICVVVESGRDVRCLLVDELLGKQEVVIKSLGDMFKKTEGLAGSAILGDGRVGLILDVNALVKLKSASLSQAA